MKKGRTATPDVAEALIRRTGDRVTAARVQILAVLLNAGSALTHSEVEARLGKVASIDRVTVYRVLDWLTQVGLAHRITEADRIWRFIVLPEGRSAGSAHFTCTCCSHTISLPGRISARSPRLPAGYRVQQRELSIRGLCSGCARPGHSPAAHSRRRAAHAR
jgi:Fur family ferric uptake transcriptional regulator